MDQENFIAILDANTDCIRDIQKTGDYRNHFIYMNRDLSICAVKIRICDPRNNKGKSHGLRVFSILGANEEKAIIFHIYPKTGSARKDNISDQEKNNIIAMIDDLSKEEA